MPREMFTNPMPKLTENLTHKKRINKWLHFTFKWRKETLVVNVKNTRV
jgi:hypothetical protein